MGTDTRTGTGKVMAEAAAQADAPARPAQLSLLGGPEAVDVAGGAEGKRQRGRPAGAENLATREMRAYLTSSFRHPAITLARLQAQDPVELARALGCKGSEAAVIIKSAAAELLPYLMGKMPVEDANGNAVLPVLQLVDPSLMAAARAAAEAGPLLDLSSLEIVGNQGVADDAQERVGQPEFDGGDEREAARDIDGGEPLIGHQPAEGGGDGDDDAEG